MSRLSILIPDATINYITNPQIRFATTGWNAQGVTLTRTLDQARFGVASLKVVTNGSATREGAFFRVSVLSGISDSVTVSAYVRGAGKVRIRLDNNVVGGTEYSSQAIKLDPNRWQRIEVSGFSTGGNDMRLYVETDENTAISRTFYVDGAQMERKPYATTYCDGDQPGCRWNGSQHESLSERNAYTRAGGRWVELAGEQREAQDLYVTTIGGLGVAPSALDHREFSLSPGGFLSSRTILPRLITFTFHAKHRVDDGDDSPASLAALHQLRELLIIALNPDSPRNEDIWFFYDDGLPMYFRARYDGGMEGDWDIRNQFVTSFPLRVLALDPYMLEDDQEATELDIQDSVAVGTFNNIVGRIDGEWSHMNYGVNGSVGDIELGRDGKLYITGAFDIVNLSPGVDPNLSAIYIAYWDGVQWRSLGAGTAGTIINDIAIAPNGDIYVTGVFTAIGGVAAKNIAKFNGTAWSALGTGLNLDGIHISIDPRGIVYVGGSFTTAGGVTAAYVAKWDGFQWRGIGQYSGLNSDVFSIAISPDGSYMYMGGSFTDERGTPGTVLRRIARYDVDTDRFTEVGVGLDANVLEVLLDPGEILYACGDFTAITGGATRISHIGKFQGGAWLPLGSGINGIVHSFDIGVNGDIVAVGEFTQAGGVDARGVALWNGSTWTNLDIDIAVGYTALLPLAVQYRANGDIHIGGIPFPTTPSIFSAINYIQNIGSAEVAPIVYIIGPGRMRYLENQTTKKRVFFDLDVLQGEEVFLDFVRGQVFSTQRGNLFHSILPGSDFHSFTLAPGENKIACFMTNDVGARMQISYQPTHWGADAVPVSPL